MPSKQTTQQARAHQIMMGVLVAALVVLGLPSAVSAAISGFNIVPASLAAGSAGNATVSFTVGAPIPADGRIVVTFPTGYTLTSATVTSSSINGGLSVSVAGLTATVVRAGGGTAASGSLSFVLDGVQNPPQSGDPGNATITTQDGVLAEIETLTSNPAGDAISAGALTVTDVEPSPAPFVTNAVATATRVSFTTANAIPANGKIEVTFPAGFTFGALVATSPNGSIGGTLADAEVGQVVTITRSGGSPVSGALLLSFTNVRAPVAAGNAGTYQIRTLTSADVVIDQELAVSGDVVSAAALTGTNVAPASLVAGAVGNVTVTFNPTNDPWPNDGKVVVTFPSAFSTSGSTAAVGNLSNGDPISVTAGAGTNTVTLTRSGGSTVSASVNFTVSNVTNPKFVGSTGSYSIVTQNSGGTTMAQDLAVGADTITAGALTGTPNVQPATLAIGAVPEQAVSFTTANPVPADGKIVVTFGAGFGLAYAGQAVGVTNFNQPGSLSASVAGQVVTLTTSGVGIIAAGTAVSFSLTNIRNPLATGSTGVYAISTTLNDGTTIDSAAPGADTIAAGGATFTALNVEPASMVTGAVGSVTTTLTLGSSLPNDGKVRVTFPAGYTVAYGGMPVATSTALGSGLTVGVSGQQVTVTRSGSGSDLTPGTAITLTFDRIRNPTVPGATGTYTIATLTSGGVVIETDATVAADTMTAGTLTATNIQPASLQAGASGSVLVTFTMANPVVTTSTFVLTFPSGFAFNSGGTTAVSGLSGLTGTLAIGSIVGTTVTLTRAGGANEGPNTVSFNLTFVKNPMTSGSTGSYGIQTRNATAVVIDQELGVSPDTITAGTLASTNVEPASLVAGASGNVVVSFSPAASGGGLPADGKVVLTLPSGFVLNNGSATAVSTTNMSGTTSISVSGQTVTVTRAGGTTITSPTVASITLTNIRNPLAGGSTGTYALSTTTSASGTIDQATVAADTIIGVSLGGTATSSLMESHVVAGGRTVELTLVGDTWAADVASDATKRNALTAALDSDGVAAGGWDAQVKPALVAAGAGAPGVTRTSATLVTVTLPAVSGFDIVGTETVSAGAPATTLTGGVALTAPTTFTVQGEAPPVTTTTTSPPATTTTSTSTPGGGGGGGGGGNGSVTTTTVAPTTTTTAPSATTTTSTPPSTTTTTAVATPVTTPTTQLPPPSTTNAPAVDRREDPPAAPKAADAIAQGDPGTKFGPPAKLDTTDPVEDKRDTFVAAAADPKAAEGAVEGGGRTMVACERDCAAPFADIEVYVASTPTLVARVRANAQGGWALAVQLPAGLPAGKHKVIVATTGKDGRPAFYANAITIVPASKVKAPPRVRCPAVAPRGNARTIKSLTAYNAHNAACIKQAIAARAFYRTLPFPGLLKLGSRGKSVLIVQQALGQREDRYYGNGLFVAVRTFQRQQKLKVKRWDVGAMNKATWNALFNPPKVVRTADMASALLS